MTKNFARPEKAISNISDLCPGAVVWELYSVRGDIHVIPEAKMVMGNLFTPEFSSSAFVKFLYLNEDGTAATISETDKRLFTCEESLKDSNVIPNSYNDHYLFTSRADAEEAAEAMRVELASSIHLQGVIANEIITHEQNKVFWADII